jgi:hypothetical protein
MPVANALLRLRRTTFRVFLHPQEAVEAELGRLGLVRRSYATTPIWQVVVFERRGA